MKHLTKYIVIVQGNKQTHAVNDIEPLANDFAVLVATSFPLLRSVGSVFIIISCIL